MNADFFSALIRVCPRPVFIVAKIAMRNFGKANLIGATAHDLITGADFSARVMAVVTGAVYVSVITRSDLCDEAIANQLGDCFAASRLAMTGEEIFWLTQSHLPMHPRAILGAFDFSVLRVGMELHLDGGATHASPLQIANTPVWSPPEISRDQIAPREIAITRAREIQDPKGLNKLFGSLRDLVGLGEGLTPAGDDFVGGRLFARWHLRAAYPDAVTWDQCAVDALIEYARPRTNVISHTILRDHARGQSVAPMHDLIAAILTGKSSDEIARHVRRLRGIGNTSGDEMLAGVLTEMQSVAGADRFWN